MTELLPCPFCDSAATLSLDTSSDYERQWVWRVDCTNFGECEAELTGFASAEAAAAKWNARRTIYRHRNGETAPPNEPGLYWFHGEVTGEITGRYTVVGMVEATFERAYNDVCGETLMLCNYAGRWWGPVVAPWEQGA